MYGATILGDPIVPAVLSPNLAFFWDVVRGLGEAFSDHLRTLCELSCALVKLLRDECELLVRPDKRTIRTRQGLLLTLLFVIQRENMMENGDGLHSYYLLPRICQARIGTDTDSLLILVFPSCGRL